MALPNARPWAPDATLVLDLARDEAAERDHRWIGTAHLLRAVVRAELDRLPASADLVVRARPEAATA